MNTLTSARPAETRPPVSRDRSFSANTLLTFATQAVRGGVMFLTWGMIARGFGPETLGQIQLVYLFSGCVLIFCDLGLPVAIIFFRGQKLYSLSHVMANALAWGLTVSSAATCLLWIGRSIVTKLLPVPPGLYLAALTWIPILLIYGYLNSILLAEKRFPALLRISLIQGTSTVCAITIGIWMLRFDAMGLTLILISGTAFAVLLQLWFLRDGWNRNELIPPSQLVRGSLSLGLRGYFANVAQFATYRLDSLIVGHISGSGPLGLYAVAYTVAEMLWYLPQMSAIVLCPTTASSTAEDANRRTASVCRVALSIGLIGGACFAVGAPWLIPGILGSRFMYSVLLLWVLLPGCVAFTYAKILSAHLTGRGHPEYASFGSLFALIATVALDFLLIPRHGIMAAAAISSFVYAAQAAYLIRCFLTTSGVRLRTILVPRRADLIELKNLNLVGRLPSLCWESVVGRVRG